VRKKGERRGKKKSSKPRKEYEKENKKSKKKSVARLQREDFERNELGGETLPIVRRGGDCKRRKDSVQLRKKSKANL